jgi:eukaryotic translation initiation factor 2C
VALKFNIHLGGNNQLLDASRRGFVDEDKTMVVGIDVTHPLAQEIRENHG